MKNPSRSVAWERIIPPATLLLFSLLAAGPLWGAGLLNTRGGGDSPFLLLRTNQLAANLRAGVFPVRWMPDAAYGLGYPFFSYYAALPYYLAAGLELLGFDILTSIKLTQTLFLAASALAMYGWAARLLNSRPGAWLAAVAYVSAPFHLVNIYVRGDSLSEFGAFAFYPLILWGFDRLAAQPSVRRALLPALAYAGLIVTHNVSALIFSPFILLYAALHITRMAVLEPDRPLGKTISRFILPLLTALLLSAWFWLPALAETEYVQLDAQTSGYFFYGNHFRGTDLVQWKILFDYAMGQNGTSPFAMGLVQASLALAGIIVVSFRCIRSHLADRDGRPKPFAHQLHGPRLETMQLAFGLLSLLLSTWLITPLSRPVWDRLPLLPMTQFPWRFLSIQALFAALLTGAAIPQSKARRRYPVWAVALALGGVLLAAALAGLQPGYLPISGDDVNCQRLQLYELFTGNIGSTIRHEYLPRWVKPRPYTGPELLSPAAPPRAIPVRGSLLSAERLKREPTHRVWQVKAGSEGSEVAFPLYYWPGWHAVVDETRVQVNPAAASGYVSLYVPPGSHTITIHLGRTPLRFGAEMASLLTVLALVAVCAKERGRQARERGTADTAQRGEQTDAHGIGSPACRLGAVVPYLVFVAILISVMALQPRVASSSSHDLTMDFEQMPYLHHNPDGVPVDGWRLIRYSYESPAGPSHDEVAAGETVSVTLEWRSSEDGPCTASTTAPLSLRLLPPAAVRHPELPAIAETAVKLGNRESAPGVMATTTLNLSVPWEAAPGLYLLQIDKTPPVYLHPVWIDNGWAPAEEPVRATFADGAIRLHDVQAAQPTPDRLHTQLDWSAVRSVAANYGLSLSLTDIAGHEWLHQDSRSGYDTQPGHGFLPTSLWSLGQVIHDPHVPALLPGAPPSDAYTLTIDLYRVATWESIGQYAQTVTLTQTVVWPDAPVLAQFGEELALSQLELPAYVRQGERLEATAYWSTVKSPSEDYVVEWRLERPGRSLTSTQPLAPGSAPRDWPADAWIAGRAALPIPPMSPPGDYTLSLTLREPIDGAPIGSYTHPTPVQIQARERLWELPEMEQSVGARFGDMIELAGYDLGRERETLHLTLYWQALTTPDRHYMFFVHLAHPETGEPASQVDTMPRGFTYPTGQWVPGEVITDQIELSTEDMAAGRYDLAIGWYDPDTRQRLQAVDSEGAPLSDDRLILPSSVKIP